jgi:myo-inositol 2-dehydrogenase/D-chiro-inositol 1-dehydrogenase
MTMAVVTETLRIGVLGVGRIGRMHAELLEHQVPGAAVTAVYDAYGPAAREVSARLGVPAKDTAAELIAAEDVDAVAICTPTGLHAEQIIAAAEAGKAIFCEKPVSLDLATVDAALAAVEVGGVPFQIGFNRRFDPAHAAVAAAVADGSVGEPHLAHITSRDPDPPPLEYARSSGGLFLDMTIHDFDMARFVVGSEIEEVFARAAVRIDPAIGEFGDVDTAVITLVHANGCLTTIDNSRRARYGYDQRVEEFGADAMAASANPPGHTATVATAAGTTAATLPYFFLQRYIPSYVREWEAFVAAVASGSAPAVGPLDARAPLVAGLAAWLSVRESRAVKTSEIAA